MPNGWEEVEFNKLATKVYPDGTEGKLEAVRTWYENLLGPEVMEVRWTVGDHSDSVVTDNVPCNGYGLMSAYADADAYWNSTQVITPEADEFDFQAKRWQDREKLRRLVEGRDDNASKTMLSLLEFADHMVGKVVKLREQRDSGKWNKE
jgi:hypothetical protein